MDETQGYIVESTRQRVSILMRRNGEPVACFFPGIPFSEAEQITKSFLEADRLAGELEEANSKLESVEENAEADEKELKKEIAKLSKQVDELKAQLAKLEKEAPSTHGLPVSAPTGDLKTPEEWCKIKAIMVMDPDGWRGRNAKSWDAPITETEFNARALHSTCSVAHEVKPRIRTRSRS